MFCVKLVKSNCYTYGMWLIDKYDRKEKYMGFGMYVVITSSSEGNVGTMTTAVVYIWLITAYKCIVTIGYICE